MVVSVDSTKLTNWFYGEDGIDKRSRAPAVNVLESRSLEKTAIFV
jgi:hypothetical protein